MVGQFYLVDYFDLWVECWVFGMCLVGEGCIVFWCIWCVLEYIIDGQQGQVVLVWMWCGVMLELCCFCEYVVDSFIFQVLVGLNNGIGGNEGVIVWQYDVQVIYNLVKRFFMFKCYVNNILDYYFEGKMVFVQCYSI